MQPLLVDPSIPRFKYEREVADLLAIAPEVRRRGWIVEQVAFPTVRVTFIAPQLSPAVALVTVEVDFTNYNVWPLSVRFLHPTQFHPVRILGLQLDSQGKQQHVVIESHPVTNEPFLCLPGVREYHSHPQHEGDSWEAHRYDPGTCLYSILNHVWLTCVKTLKGYMIPLPPIVSQQANLQWQAQPDGGV